MADLNSKFEDDELIDVEDDSPPGESEEESGEEINSAVEQLKDEITAKEKDTHDPQDGEGDSDDALLNNELNSKEFADLLSSVEKAQQSLRGEIEDEVQSILAEEIKKAKQELVAENRKAITQIVEYQKSLIQEIVGAEKQAIWEQVDHLKESLAKKYSEELGVTKK
jgi:hypothetical protein